MHRRNVIPYLIAATVLGACSSREAAIAEQRTRLEQTSQTVSEQDAARTEAVADAEAVVASIPDTADACPVDVGSLAVDDPRLSVVSEQVVAETAGPLASRFEERYTDLMARILLLEEPSASDVEELGAAVDDATERWAWDATMVVDHRTHPDFDDETGYQPGVIEAYLVIWDYAAGRIVCGGPLAATNSPDVLEVARADEASAAEFEADPVAWLERDVLEVALSAGLENLRSVE